MFNEVKIYDGQGNLKQLISPKELHGAHWDKFQENNSVSSPSISQGARRYFNPGCEICGTAFYGERSTSTCCGPNCKAEKSRRYQKDRYKKIANGEVSVTTRGAYEKTYTRTFKGC